MRLQRGRKQCGIEKVADGDIRWRLQGFYKMCLLCVAGYQS